MTSDDFLFGEPDHDAVTPQSPQIDDDIAEWQVQQIRTAFAARMTDDMCQRQQFIQSVTGRKVDRIRDLSRVEARRVLERLPSQPSGSSRSSWDDRDGETWIDRL